MRRTMTWIPLAALALSGLVMARTAAAQNGAQAAEGEHAVLAEEALTTAQAAQAERAAAERQLHSQLVSLEAQLAAATAEVWAAERAGLQLAQFEHNSADLERLRRAEEQMRAAAEQFAGQFGGFARSGRTPFVAYGGSLGVTVENFEQGARVTAVSPGGPAAAAGVAIGDVITAVDGTRLAVPGDAAAGAQTPTQLLLAQVTGVASGQTVQLEVLRDGKTVTLPVTANSPAFNYAYARTGNARAGDLYRLLSAPPFAPDVWGDMQLVALTPALGAYFGTDAGMLVVRGPADASLGIRDGDVILSVSGREPTSPEHALRILSSFAPGEPLEVAIMRRQQRETVKVQLPEP